MRRVVYRIGIHDQRSGQLPGGAREAAQDQHAALVISRADEFLRDQVHAIMEAADVAEIGSPQKSVDLLGLVVRLEQDDGTVGAGSQSAR